MVSVELFTRDKIDAVLEFEAKLRRQEPDTFFMDAGESYRPSSKLRSSRVR